MPRYSSRLLLACIFIAACIHPALAHANFVRSDPPANAHLTQAPQHIRLWFSEPLEFRFSHAELVTRRGELIPDVQQYLEDADPYQMVLEPPALADGLYTVTWRVVSATDGHATEGSFVFTIGASASPSAASGNPAVSTTITSVPLPQNALLRGLNFVSQAWLMGVFGFGVFVWWAAGMHDSTVERVLRRSAWFGWLLVGLASLLMLVLQAALFAGVTLNEMLHWDGLAPALTTRFGTIWLIRMGLWVGIGVVLRRYSRHTILLSILSAALLLTTSLHSHADSAQAVALDWLHLLAASVWIGGLIAFTAILPGVYQHTPQPIPVLARLVAYFSNLGRAAVITLVITGTLTAWQRIGSLEALFNTTYGQILLVKLALFAPLLGSAGINLVFTARGLRQGSRIWSRRLWVLVTIEVMLGVSIMLAAGALTSVNPEQLAQPPASDTQPLEVMPDTSLMQMQMSATLHAHLYISPGTVGENTFIVTLADMHGNPVTDASRIRLRFDNLTRRSGTSELRPELDANGGYSIAGANLSLLGIWRIRMTIQRPGEFDSVLDFEFELPDPES